MRTVLKTAAAIALGAALATAFIAYRQPALLLDAINVRYCG